MTPLEEQQNARFAALDPQLPPIAAPPMTSDPLLVTVAGRKAGGLLTHVAHAPASWPALWGPAEIWDLTAVPGETGAAGLAALLGAWRERLRGSGAGPDSGCTLTWPSRDEEASAVLLAHGFAPMTCLAVRPVEPPPDPGPARVRVRRAGPGDVEALTELRLAEWRYTSLVGTAVPRPDARERLRAEVLRALRFSGLAWLAEDDGVPAGMAACALTTPAPGDSIHGRLLPGLWGYVDTLSVAPAARDGGVGRALMAAAHQSLLSYEVRGTFLFYHPANPLSPVFWHRQGYRPLWTMWIRRPAWS
ncbi:GNAT family N-acetyltransferase [Amycolatopsis sp. NPDC088138]|uniref:GNAT family N-acetyltransferase n=1 Tax=Amycolatopsis sp. NPDC088138 TaxID=3363938 RepID=UPI00382352A3